MSSNEKLAIAAHLHVLMRSKTGRVTDTEWMASTPAYAAEIIRLAHLKAAMTTWACWPTGWRRPWRCPTRLSTGRWPSGCRRPPRAMPWRPAPGARPAPPFDPSGHSVFGDSQPGTDGTQRLNAPRYIKGLR